MRRFRKIHTILSLLDCLGEEKFEAVRIRSTTGQKSINYGQFKSHILHCAEKCKEFDWNGRQIVLIGDSGYGWLVWFFTILIKGGTAVLIDNRLPKEIITSMIAQTEATDTLIEENSLDKINDNQKDEQRIIEFSNKPDKYSDEAVMTLEKLPIVTEDMAAIIAFTSGTTGVNKMVQLTHKNICSDIMSCYDYFEDELGPDRSVLPMVPFAHMFGLTAGVLIPIYYKMPVFLIKSLKYVSIAIREMQPYILIAVPAMIENMVRRLNILLEKEPDRKKEFIKQFFGNNMKIIVSGGAKLRDDIYNTITNWGIILCNGYGMTECSPIITCNPIKNTKAGSVGKIFSQPYKEVKIKDEEIMVRGDIVMSGYYENDQENNKVFHNGWLSTGDMGYIDEEGYLFITGRKKNLIILSDGNNVAPEELENQISSCPWVTSVLVNSESNVNGEYLVANIYPDYEYAQLHQESDVRDKIELHVKNMNQKLPSFKRISRINIEKQDFEKNMLGKAKRNKYLQKL